MKVVAKRSLSQNFLVNPQIRNKVLEQVEHQITQHSLESIVEIGPGTGLLTTELANLEAKIWAIELDPRAIEVLNYNPDLKNVKIIESDALKLISNPKEWGEEALPENNFLLFGNLPFHAGSRILIETSLSFPSIPIVVILQKEVVEKIASSEHLTFFGAWLALNYRVEKQFNIPAGNFQPKPKVDAALVSLSPYKSEKLGPYLDNPKQRVFLFKLVKALFKFPRKTIGNNLKNYFSAEQFYQLKSSVNDDFLNTRVTKANLESVLQTLILESI